MHSFGVIAGQRRQRLAVLLVGFPPSTPLCAQQA